MLSLAFHMALSLVCTNKMHNKDVQHEACFREQLIARLCFASGVATVAKAATALCARPPAHVEDNITPLRTLYAAPLNEHDLSHHAFVLHVCIPKSKCS